MTIQVREFIQTSFKNAGITHFVRDGDYYTAENLYLDPSGTCLRLAPAWSDELELPQYWNHKGAAAFAADDGAYIFVGQHETTDSVQIIYPNTLADEYFVIVTTNVTGDITGKDKRNVVYHNGLLYLITTTGVWAGAYTATTYTQLYSGSDARLLSIIENNVFLVLSDGRVMQLNAGETAFEQYYTPEHDLDPQFLAHFRSYILYAASREDGTLDIYRLSTSGLSGIASIPGSGKYLAHGSLFAVHDDNFYFSPGIQRASGMVVAGSNVDALMLYEFDGSRIELITETPAAALDREYQNFGLLPWHSHLLYYDLRGGLSTAPTLKTQYIDLLRPNKTFSTLMPLTMYNNSWVECTMAAIHNLGGELFALGTGDYNGENPL